LLLVQLALAGETCRTEHLVGDNVRPIVANRKWLSKTFVNSQV